MSQFYRCSHCKEEFEVLEEWTEEMRLKEAEEVLGQDWDPAQYEALCDDCYQDFLLWFGKQTEKDKTRYRKQWQ